MAKRKQRRRRRQNSRYQSELYAAASLFFLGFGLLELGFVGRFIMNLGRLFVGSLAHLTFILLMVLAIFILLKGKQTFFKSRIFKGGLGLLVLAALVLHIMVYGSLASDSAEIIPVTFANGLTNMSQYNHFPMGGGLLGASLFTLTSFTFGVRGSYLVSLIAGLALLCYIFHISWQDLMQATQAGFEVLSAGWASLELGEIGQNLKAFCYDIFTGSEGEKKPSSAERQKRVAAAHENKKAQEEAEEATRKTQVKDKQPRRPVEIIGPDDKEKEAPVDLPLDLGTEEKTSSEANLEDEEEITLHYEEENPAYTLPTADLLDKRKRTDQSPEYQIINRNIQKLDETFESFNVDAHVVKAQMGPAVTKYEIEPAVGTKVSKITNLADDLALALAAKDIRIEAPIPGKSVIGIEVPNQNVRLVSIRESVEEDTDTQNLLEVPLGRTINGGIQMADLTKMPHLLIAGSTGSGKSVCINSIIVSILMKAKPNEVKMMMIDPKKVELNVYNDIPHLLTPVVTNPRKAAQALNKVVIEMERRYELFAQTGTRNISGYNEHVQAHRDKTAPAEGEEATALPFIVVIVDELADLMMVASKEVEAAITRLAQMARAAGIHMILATQRPSVDVITGIIKSNVPSRIAFAVSSGTDSRTILDKNGAEKLLGRGDMLYMPMGEGKPIRVQGAFITDEEVERVSNFVKGQQEAHYFEEMTPVEDEQGVDHEELDELWPDVLNFLKERETVSISMLQRKFRIGYNRAARLVDDLESQQLVGPQEGSKPRQVYLEETSPEDKATDQKPS